MKIHNPYFLSLLWLIPAMIVFFIWSFKHKKSLIERFVSAELRERLLIGFSPLRQRLKAMLLILVVLFAILSLIRPQWGFHWEEVKQRGVDIMVAVDVSQSMLAQDVEPNRLERAKRKIIDLLRIVQGDRIGLIAFAGASFLQCPLTLDYGTVRLFLDYLDADLIPIPGTGLSLAIDEAIRAFEGSGEKSKALILITDGEDHLGKPLESAKKAAEKNVRIYTVGIGKEGGAPIPSRGGGFKKNQQGELILTKLDEDTLQKIALETGGSYVRSISGDLDLEKIYEHIRKSLEEKELKSGRQRRFEERFQWPLIIALLLLALEALVAERKLKIGQLRIPWRLVDWGSKNSGKTLFLFALLLSGSPIQPLSESAMASPEREGVRFYRNQKYDEALKKLLDAQIEDPSNLGLKYNLANTYYRLGQYDKAEKLFEAIATRGEKPLAQKSYYNLGNTTFRMGKLQETIQHYEKALELDPNDADAKFNLEFARNELKKRIEESEKTRKECQNPSQQQKNNQEDNQNQQSGQNEKSEEKNKEDEKNSQSQEKQKDEKERGSEEQQTLGEQKEGTMSKEEADRWLSALKEDRKKFMQNQNGTQRRYRTDKDW